MNPAMVPSLDSEGDCCEDEGLVPPLGDWKEMPSRDQENNLCIPPSTSCGNSNWENAEEAEELSSDCGEGDYLPLPHCHWPAPHASLRLPSSTAIPPLHEAIPPFHEAIPSFPVVIPPLPVAIPPLPVSIPLLPEDIPPLPEAPHLLKTMPGSAFMPPSKENMPSQTLYAVNSVLTSQSIGAKTVPYSPMLPSTPTYISLPPCTPPYTSPLPSTVAKKSLLPCKETASTLLPYREALSPLPPYSVPYSRLPPGSLFDSHCHLDFLSRRLGLGPSLDLRQLVTSDPQLDWASFGGCVAVYCHPRDWRGGPSLSLQRAAGEDRAHLALGCHPHYSNLWHPGSTKYELEAAVKSLGPRLVALGECGLDYTRKNLVAREQQMRVFREQVLLALRLNMPLVLHIREAEEDGLRVLETAGLPRDWPIHRHCFTGGLTWMLLLLSHSTENAEML